MGGQVRVDCAQITPLLSSLFSAALPRYTIPRLHTFGILPFPPRIDAAPGQFRRAHPAQEKTALNASSQSTIWIAPVVLAAALCCVEDQIVEELRSYAALRERVREMKKQTSSP